MVFAGNDKYPSVSFVPKCDCAWVFDTRTLLFNHVQHISPRARRHIFNPECAYGCGIVFMKMPVLQKMAGGLIYYFTSKRDTPL